MLIPKMKGGWVSGFLSAVALTGGALAPGWHHAAQVRETPGPRLVDVITNQRACRVVALATVPSWCHTQGN